MNSEDYYDFEKNPKKLFSELHIKLAEIDPNICFEFSPVLEDKKRELIISADGIKEAFPAVLQLVKKAPPLPQWKIIAFRPRNAVEEIRVGNLTLSLDDLFFKYQINNNKFDISIFTKRYQNDKNLLTAIYLALDSLLGEYDVETKIGLVEIGDFETVSKNQLISLNKLPQILDDHFRSNIQEIVDYNYEMGVKRKIKRCQV